MRECGGRSAREETGPVRHDRNQGAPLKRFVCGSIIPGCDRVFIGPGDQSVLDQALEHAAVNHGLAAAPMPFIELVLTYTRPFSPTANRGHLRVQRDLRLVTAQ